MTDRSWQELLNDGPEDFESVEEWAEQAARSHAAELEDKLPDGATIGENRIEALTELIVDSAQVE